MKKNSLNPKAVIVTVLTTILSLVIAVNLKIYVFDGLTKWSQLLFFIVFAALASLGAFLSGRFLNKKTGGRRKW